MNLPKILSSQNSKNSIDMKIILSQKQHWGFNLFQMFDLIFLAGDMVGSAAKPMAKYYNTVTYKI